MKFGLFVPQGWRMDLVGIDPAQHWGVMAGLARRADANDDWTSIWVYDHFHTVPMPSRGGDARGLDADGRLRRGHRTGAAGPDVHVHGLPQPGLPREGGRDHRHHLRGPPRDGHRRRLVRARVARLRLRLPDRRRADPPARGGCPDLPRHVDQGRRPPSPGSTTRSTGRSARPSPSRAPCSPGSKANGIPIWIAGGGEKKTLRIAAQYADYTNFDGALDGFKHKSRDPAGALRGARPRLQRDRAQRQLQRRDRPGRERGEEPAGLDPRAVPPGRADRGQGRRAGRGQPRAARLSAPPSRSSRSSRRSRPPG